ncbi:hypothetical protein ACFX11_020923 [Malus domestica]
MGRYQRHHHHQWGKVDKPCAAVEKDEDSLTTTFLMEFANSGYNYKRTSPKLLYLLFISFFSCSFILAPHIFNSNTTFSLLYLTSMEDMKVNVPMCSSISNAAESATHISWQVTPGESPKLQPSFTAKSPPSWSYSSSPRTAKRISFSTAPKPSSRPTEPFSGYDSPTPKSSLHHDTQGAGSACRWHQPSGRGREVA